MVVGLIRLGALNLCTYKALKTLAQKCLSLNFYFRFWTFLLEKPLEPLPFSPGRCMALKKQSSTLFWLDDAVQKKFPFWNFWIFTHLHESLKVYAVLYWFQGLWTSYTSFLICFIWSLVLPIWLTFYFLCSTTVTQLRHYHQVQTLLGWVEISVCVWA